MAETFIGRKVSSLVEKYNNLFHLSLSGQAKGSYFKDADSDVILSQF
jgi:hypothetical protein